HQCIHTTAEQCSRSLRANVLDRWDEARRPEGVWPGRGRLFREGVDAFAARQVVERRRCFGGQDEVHSGDGKVRQSNRFWFRPDRAEHIQGVLQELWVCKRARLIAGEFLLNVSNAKFLKRHLWIPRYRTI